MSQNLGYWYSGIGNGSHTAEIPPQALPISKKGEKWQKATMDALERIGVQQLRENLKFRDFYRMVDGKMSYSELSDVIPQLREVGEMLDDLEIPTFIKHHDLIGIVINALIGEYIQNNDKYVVTNVDEIATNEYLREKKELVMNYIQEEFEKELQLRLMERGMNPLNNQQFNSEEERQAYMQQLQQTRAELTPPEIQKYMDTGWKTKAVVWGENTLEADREYLKLDKLDRKNLKDFLLTGRCFRHYRLGYDFYEAEHWSPLNTFFSQEVDTEEIENGQYVGRIHYYSPSSLINKYGHKLTKRQKEQLMGKDDYIYETEDKGSLNFEQVLDKNFGETHIVPHANYYDHQFLLGIQDEFGIPLGERTYKNKDGSESTVPVFLPNYRNEVQGASYFAQAFRDDIPVRPDLIQVTEAYFISYKLIGYITYISDTGRLTQEIVTEELLRDFLKENDIKQLHTRTLEEVEENPEPNTIVWDYVPEVWMGTKINCGNAYIDEDIYLDVKPTPFQLKGEGNVYNVKLPVAGIVGNGMALKLQPFQSSYNVVMNQLYNLLEKEIGLFFIFDINFLPSEYKEWGDTEETLMHLRNLTKDVGLFPVDSSRQNVKDGGGFNQFSPQNLSFSGQIADRINLSEFYKQKMFEQIGFTPERLGTPVKYQTAEGVKTSQEASFSQTETYFETFSDFQKNALEMHLNVAQYAQSENKDIKVFYTKSDNTKSFLEFQDPYFPLRKMGILPVSNAKKRRELKSFKDYLLNTNTLGGDEMAIAKLFTSDTMTELIDAARSERLRRQDELQAERAHELEVVDRNNQAADDRELKQWQREEYSKQKDRENKIQLEKIESLGRAVDNDSDQNKLTFITDQADLAIKKEKNDKEVSIKETQNEITREKNMQDFQLGMKALKNEALAIKQRMDESQNNKYIARVNKN